MLLPLVVFLLLAVIIGYVLKSSTDREIRDRKLRRIQKELNARKIAHLKEQAAKVQNPTEKSPPKE